MYYHYILSIDCDNLTMLMKSISRVLEYGSFLKLFNRLAISRHMAEKRHDSTERCLVFIAFLGKNMKCPKIYLQNNTEIAYIEY